MTATTLLAHAAEAERAADDIFAKLDAAPKRPHPDGGHYCYPIGSAGEVQRACDLKRRASYLRAEAAEIVLDSATEALPATSAEPVAPIETNETPTSTTLVRVAPLVRASVVEDPVEAVAARILASDRARVGGDGEAGAVAKRIAAA